MAQANAEYIEQNDIFGRFIEDCCTRDPKLFTRSKVILEAYNYWAREEGEYELSATQLGGRLTERGITPKKRSGQRGWLGIAVNESTINALTRGGLISMSDATDASKQQSVLQVENNVCNFSTINGANPSSTEPLKTLNCTSEDVPF